MEDVEAFTYFGAVLDKQGGTEGDIKRRLALVKNVFARPKPLCISTSSRTKMRIFNTNVMAVLLHDRQRCEEPQPPTGTNWILSPGSE